MRILALHAAEATGRGQGRCGYLVWCGSGKGCVHGPHMCGVKGKGLEVGGFSRLGMTQVEDGGLEGELE